MSTTAGKPLACQISTCDLLRRCLLWRRDEDWREFTRRLGTVIRTMCTRTLTRHRRRLTVEEIDEHVQEVYLRLLAGGGESFRGHTEEELRRYLGRLIWNLVADRKRRDERLAAREAAVPRDPGQEAHWMWSPPPSPERHVIARQGLRVFLESCRRAACGYQTELKLRVIHLAFLDGCSSREIARRLSRETAAARLTPSQVDSMIFRLRRRLAHVGIEVPRRYGDPADRAA